MTFEVLRSFSDTQDGEHVYVVGDEFPRHGFSVSDERVKELSGCENAFKCPLIRAVAVEKPEAKEIPTTAEKPAKRAKKAKE